MVNRVGPWNFVRPNVGINSIIAKPNKNVIRYLTGVSNAGVRAVAHRYAIGLLATPDTGYLPQIDAYPFWAADNACFNHPETFSMDAYCQWLMRFTVSQVHRCLFAPAPDVLGDARRTLDRGLETLPMLRLLGFRAALVAQDGLEHLVVPWDEFDVLFLGGSTAWKLSQHARSLSLQAKSLGKGLHMGRVNSFRRLKLAQDFGCDTADGTYLAFGPDINLPKLLGWLDRLRSEETQCAFI